MLSAPTNPFTINASPAGRPLRSPRIRTLAGVGAAAVVVALGAGTIATSSGTAAASTPTGITAQAPTGDSVAEAALTSARLLADGDSAAVAIPADVVNDLGYTPIIENSQASRGDGDCSSPVPLPAAFEPACRVHDLGYDLLRVAHRHGAPIPAGLRSDLDALLAQQMHDTCGTLPCTVMADVAHIAVGINTVRQGNGAPVEESLPW